MTFPRLEFRSPMTSPTLSLPTFTTMFMIGSSKTRPASGAAFLKANGTGNLECHLGGIHRMEGAVIKNDLYINNRISGKNAFLHSLNDAFFYGRPILLRDNAADNLVDKLEFFSRDWR